MYSRAFFAARWVIVFVWGIGVLPISVLAIYTLMSPVVELPMPVRFLGSVLTLGSGLYFLTIAWRVAAYPLLTVTGGHIHIARPSSHRKPKVIDREMLQGIEYRDERIRLKLTGGIAHDLDLRWLADADREILFGMISETSDRIAA